MSNETKMPEEIWLNRELVTPFTIPFMKQAKEYRLKSSEDKTIQELTGALRDMLITHSAKTDSMGMLDAGSEIARGRAKQALSNNAPRIAEAQERK